MSRTETGSASVICRHASTPQTERILVGVGATLPGGRTARRHAPHLPWCTLPGYLEVSRRMLRGRPGRSRTACSPASPQAGFEPGCLAPHRLARAYTVAAVLIFRVGEMSNIGNGTAGKLPMLTAEYQPLTVRRQQLTQSVPEGGGGAN